MSHQSRTSKVRFRMCGSDSGFVSGKKKEFSDFIQMTHPTNEVASITIIVPYIPVSYTCTTDTSLLQDFVCVSVSVCAPTCVCVHACV